MRDTPPRVNLHRLLDREQIRHLSRRSTLRGIGMIAHCWAVILAAMALVAWLPNPATILLAIAVIGSRQLGLGILMHEGAHGGLAKSPALNLWLSQWLCAYPSFAEAEAYRRYHLAHHEFAQMEQDPDLVLSEPFPTSRASLRRKFIRDLTGQTGLKLRYAQFAEASGKRDDSLQVRLAKFFNVMGKPILVNAALWATLAALGFWWLYPVLWLVPMLTWFQFVSRIRSIAEHAMVPDADPWRVARTTHAGFLARAFLAPYKVNYHAEHHALLYVPCYRLPQMQRLLRESGLIERFELAPNYRTVLRKAASAQTAFVRS